MSVQRTLIVLTTLTLALPVGGSLLRANQAETEAVAQQEQLARRQTALVQRGDVSSTLSALGSLSAAADVDVSFQASGEVAEVLVETGDYVYAGQPLARLTSTTQQINYEQALLNLERATINLEDLLGPVDANDIRVAEANINSARGNYTSIANNVTDDDLRAAELRYQQAQNEYLEYERARRVSGNLDEREVAQLDAQLGALTFDAEIARLELESLRDSNSSSLGEASARIVQAQRQLEQVLAGPSQSQINNAEVDVVRAEASLREAETALNRTTLVSPADGIITSVDIKVGQTIGTGSPVVEITDTSYFRLMASVDETDITNVEAGMSAYVRLDALPGVDLPAHVARIDTLGTETNNVVSYTAEVVLDTPDPRVRVGMTGEAFFRTQQSSDALLVPNTYLLAGPEGDTFVSVLMPSGEVDTVEVQTGLRGETHTEVLSGLREGDVVVLEG